MRRAFAATMLLMIGLGCSVAYMGHEAHSLFLAALGMGMVALPLMAPDGV